MKFLSMGFFGILGVFARYFCSVWFADLAPSHFPFGTLFINLLGSFLVGILWVLGMERGAIPHSIFLGMVVGFTGGFTTFSAYCLETIRLLEQSQISYALLYVSLNPLLWCVAVYAGMTLTRLNIN